MGRKAERDDAASLETGWVTLSAEAPHVCKLIANVACQNHANSVKQRGRVALASSNSWGWTRWMRCLPHPALSAAKRKVPRLDCLVRCLACCHGCSLCVASAITAPCCMIRLPGQRFGTEITQRACSACSLRRGAAKLLQSRWLSPGGSRNGSKLCSRVQRSTSGQWPDRQP